LYLGRISRAVKGSCSVLLALVQVMSADGARANDGCRHGYYRNSDRLCLSRPVRSASEPIRATARCRDGTYSFSQHRRGTCSRHGGVVQWL
jgi:hypothetical protein